jgi:hypothetical protein
VTLVNYTITAFGHTNDVSGRNNGTIKHCKQRLQIRLIVGSVSTETETVNIEYKPFIRSGKCRAYFSGDIASDVNEVLMFQM